MEPTHRYWVDNAYATFQLILCYSFLKDVDVTIGVEKVIVPGKLSNFSEWHPEGFFRIPRKSHSYTVLISWMICTKQTVRM